MKKLKTAIKFIISLFVFTALFDISVIIYKFVNIWWGMFSVLFVCIIFFILFAYLIDDFVED